MLDDPDIISRKFKRAVTDSENEVRYDPATKPGVSNLLEILGAATGQKPDDAGQGLHPVRTAKSDAADAVIELLTPIQARYRELAGDPGELAALLRKGADKARAVASVTLRRAYDAVGLLPRGRVNPTDRRIIGLAVPALGSLAVEPLYVLVDTAIIGRLGTAQLGGLALAATVLALVVAGCNFLTYGTTERVARRLGAGRPSAAADVAVQTMWLSAIVGARPGAARRPGCTARRRLARRQRRRPRLRRHLPAHRGDRPAVRPRVDGRRGRAARRGRLPHRRSSSCSWPTSSTPCSRCCSCSASTGASPVRRGRP